MNKQENLSCINCDSRIYVAGHRGMVGSAIVRYLTAAGYKHIVTRSHDELELTDQQAVRDFFSTEKIDCIILAAAKVGGIYANNTYPAEFIYSNLIIQANVIHQAYLAGVQHLLFLGSSCVYPKFAPQPMREEHLLTGMLEPTNEPYAIAKISGIKMCEAYNRQYGTSYFSVMPTNLYGPDDNYHLENSHVIPAIIRKYHLTKMALEKNLTAIQRDEAVFGPIPVDIKKAIGLNEDSSSLSTMPPHVMLWGTGQARREFLYVDDMAAACLFLLEKGRCVAGENGTQEGASLINIGTGKDITIGEVAEMIRVVVGFEGETRYNSDQPDGTPRKLLDTTRINSLGWTPDVSLRAGLQQTYEWYCRQLAVR